MTGFENFLLERGYLAFSLNCKTMKYDKSKHISTMVNLDNRYIHKSDVNLLDKIDKGLSVTNGITWDDRRNVIIFGLHEAGKPPTLISPRPNIKINGSVKDKFLDDAVNIALNRVDNDRILEAMFDDSIILDININE